MTATVDATVKVWDAQNGVELLTLKGHDNMIFSVSYSPDGEQIITASGDRTAKVWDGQTGVELFTLKGHEGGVLSASYSPDGRRIVTTGSDGIIQIFTTDTDELLDIAGQRITRRLTTEEKEKYGVPD